MIAPIDALASAVELALRNTESRLYRLPVKAPDDVRRPLEAEKRVYENALALARGGSQAEQDRELAALAGFTVEPIGEAYRVRFPSGALTRGGFKAEADAWASAARAAIDLQASGEEPPYLIR